MIWRIIETLVVMFFAGLAGYYSRQAEFWRSHYKLAALCIMKRDGNLNALHKLENGEADETNHSS